MSLLNIVVLAIVQGITEFLPVSSSGHLVLIAPLTGWPDQGGLIDVSVHVGTLVAVVVYFRRDLAEMVGHAWRLLHGGRERGARLLFYLLLATVPVVVAGGLVEWLKLRELFRSVEVVAWTTLVFGLVLFFADRMGMTVRRLEHMRGGHALLIGLAQVLALVPGTSRAGITITAARALGFERREATRFSMLLSIPTIVAAGGLAGIEILHTGDLRLSFQAVLAAVLSCVVALFAIAALMAWLRRATFTPFVIYRTILGLALLAWAYL